MKSFQALKAMFWGVLFAIGILCPAQVQAHGGLSMAEDLCVLKVGPYNMHFTGYQPRLTKETQFCEDIPAVGYTVVVLDYLEYELRSLPTEVRIIRDTGSEQNLEADTILHMPPKVYPGGSVDFEYNFDKPGKFVGLVTVGNEPPHVSRFPFSVGDPKWPWATIFGVLAGIGLLAFIIYYFRLPQAQNSSPAQN
jgi:hypothetical protein